MSRLRSGGAGVFLLGNPANVHHAEAKRKASDEPSSPISSKRVKHDDSAEPENKVMKTPAIPFPEKVSLVLPR